MNIFTRIKHIDKLMLAYILFLVSIGFLAITSATRANITGDYSIVIKQIFFFIMGISLMLFITIYDFSWFNEGFRIITAIFLYLINLGFLSFVLIAGKTSKGAERWISLGFFDFQPSEIGKVIIIFFFAALIASFAKNINKISIIILNIVLLLVPIGLIMMQPSLSTSIIYIAIFGIQMFIVKLDYRYIVSGIVIVLVLIFLLILDAKQQKHIFLTDYQSKRILALLEPGNYKKEEAYQTRKSIEAIGSGRFYGKGIFKGNLNKAEYLPEPHTDFIFSIIAEESGFLLCIVIILVYFLMLIRLVNIAWDVKDLFKKLLIMGVVGMIFFQVFVNIGVVSGILPNTGMPLPLISYGGNALLTNMISIGMVLNIDVSRKSRYMII